VDVVPEDVLSFDIVEDVEDAGEEDVDADGNYLTEPGIAFQIHIPLLPIGWSSG